MIRILLYGSATIVMIGGAAFYPEYRYLYLLFVVLGLAGTWKAYRRWEEARAKTYDPADAG
ncbi:MAG: hypothetical protein PVJ76_04385 [Gemmatimonadota bacterium]|jgi:hypothetical protein